MSNKNELTNILKKTHFCRYLEAKEIDLLIAHSTVISYAPNKLILRQGKKGNSMYIIIDGTAGVVARILGEGLTQLATITSGNFFGEICVIEKRAYAASIISKTSMQCLCIISYYFETLSLFFPETKYKITLAITEEVISRIIISSSKIIKAMAQSDMVSPIIASKGKEQPTEINLTELDVQKKQLKDCPFFKSLTPDEFKTFLKFTKLIKTPSHHTIIHEEENSKICYFVLRGSVQLFIVHGEKRAKLAVLGPMSFFSNISLIEKEIPSIVHYETYDQAILFKIDEHSIEEIKKNNLLLWYKIFDYIGKSFVALERAADELEIRLHGELYNR